MKEKQTMQTVRKSIAAFFQENRRMLTFIPKTELRLGGVVTAVIRKYQTLSNNIQDL
jgi:hypothetical protein